MGSSGFTITPRKGEFLILDKSARAHVPHILLPVPTRISKGILVAPTINGNVLLGPTADDIQDKTDLSVTTQGLTRARSGALQLAPVLENEPIVATYAGLRPAASTGEYVIEVDAEKNRIVTARHSLDGSFRRPRHCVRGVGAAQDCKRITRCEKAIHPASSARVGNRTRAALFQSARLQENPDFGRILCLCETVSHAEVTQAIHAPVPATTLDAIKKRTWAMAAARAFTAPHPFWNCWRTVGRPLSELTKRGTGSEVIGSTTS